MIAPLARILLPVLGLMASALPVLAQGIDIQPSSVEIPAEPGERYRQMLTVTNLSDEVSRGLTVGLADWTLSRQGALALSPEGTDERSATGWTRITPAYLPLAPGQSGKVIVDIIVPAKPAAAGDYKLALMASQVAPGADGRMLKTEGASLFYLTIQPAMSAPEVSGARIAGIGGDRRLEVDLSNSGNAHARLEGKIRIEGRDGTGQTYPVTNLVVLAASERTFAIPLDGPLPQQARITVTLDDISAPQASTGVAPLRTYSAPLDTPAG